LLTIAWRSGWNRHATLALVAFSIGLSTFLLVGFERVRADIRASFSQSVSGTDLIVGARTGCVQLMLYSIFHLGGATNNIRMDSVRAIEQNRNVAWIVPLSLGDSHHGQREHRHGAGRLPARWRGRRAVPRRHASVITSLSALA
jgi:putative ABC transport system permease protein